MTQTFPPPRAVTSGPRHHFFGYYDKCPWDSSGRYLLTLETAFMDRPPRPDDTATIGLIDTAAGNQFTPIAETRAWNWQQGCMLHWLPRPHTIIYNDRIGGQFASVVRDLQTGEVRLLPLPVYAVTRDGTAAVTLNFARLHHQRPGYGYAGMPDPWEDDPEPDDDGIYWVDLESGGFSLIISIAEIAAYRRDPTMEGAYHRFNHLLFAPDDSRFIFLHRWRRPGERGQRTRLFTARPDGSDVYCVADQELVSHFDWRNPRQILAWARQRPLGDRYYLFTDQTDEVVAVSEGILTRDGHCSYGPDGRWILTDTYPDAERMRTLLLFHPESNRLVELGRFYAPPELDGEIRCDLHPRWSRDGRQICFDSVHEGTRQMYVVDVPPEAAG